MRIATDNFVGKGRNSRFALNRASPQEIISNYRQMVDTGPGLQNLVDAIKAKGYGGTIGCLLGAEGAPSGTYLNRNTPIYRLRRDCWFKIFNHGMKANPAGGMMHTLESLVSYTEIANDLLRQIDCFEHSNLQVREQNSSWQIDNLSVG